MKECESDGVELSVAEDLTRLEIIMISIYVWLLIFEIENILSLVRNTIKVIKFHI